MAERSIDAKIAEHQAKIARLRDKKNKDQTRLKILVGAVYLDSAYGDPQETYDMISKLNAIKWRETDRKLIEPLIAELKGSIGE